MKQMKTDRYERISQDSRSERELLGDEKIEFSYYREILEQGIASHQLAVIPPSKDQVVIGDIERSRSMDKKTVYVLGADSTGMPRVSKGKRTAFKRRKDLLAAQGIVLPSNQGAYRQQRSASHIQSHYKAFSYASYELCCRYREWKRHTIRV